MITTDYNTKERINPEELQDLSAIAGVKISNIKLESYPELLVFPHSFSTYDKGFGNKTICSIKDGSLSTNSIVGFVGRNETQLSIHSRFSKDRENDFLLHYLLQTVAKHYLINLPHTHTCSEDGVFDFLFYLFPLFLKKALKKGLFKEYVTHRNNDSNVHGAIDLTRHIRSNVPFVGNIAYRTREFDYDNKVTQLIRHTIEYISNTQLGIDVLQADDETRQAVRMIREATPSFSYGGIQKIINMNFHSVSHPYFDEYRNLQKLCLQILRHDKLRYSHGDDVIYGVLIDVAWLWEEYLAVVLQNRFIHYDQEHGEKLYLFEGERNPRIIPDYLSKDKQIVLDAKYIRLNEMKEYTPRNVRDLYYKTLAYMLRFGAKKGYLLFPIPASSPDNDLTHKKVQSTDFSIIEVGMRIPEYCNNYFEFVKRMSQAEDDLILKLTT